MSTVRAGSRTSCCSLASTEAAVVCPVGRWKILWDCSWVGMNGSHGRPQYDVAPKSKTAVGASCVLVVLFCVST